MRAVSAFLTKHLMVTQTLSVTWTISE